MLHSNILSPNREDWPGGVSWAKVERRANLLEKHLGDWARRICVIADSLDA
jgi:hypothetical protein